MRSLLSVILAVAIPTGAIAIGCKSNDIGVVNNNGPGVSEGGARAQCHAMPPTSKPSTAPMALVGLTDGQTCYWIDETEVTVAQYDAFLADTASKAQDPSCSANTSFTPDPACTGMEAGAAGGGGAPDAGELDAGVFDAGELDASDPDAGDAGIDTSDAAGSGGDAAGSGGGGVDAGAIAGQTLPIACVNWCDAWAYCAWAGKTLCKGGASADDPSTNRWYSACAEGGKKTYPNSDGTRRQTCNATGGGNIAPVGTSTCATSDGVQDLSGNVAEWVDECDSTGECNVRGGSVESNAGEASCKGIVTLPKLPPEPSVLAYVGFRCCVDAPPGSVVAPDK